MDVPDERRSEVTESKIRRREHSGRTRSLFVTLDPGVLVLPAVAFLRSFDVQLLITELVGRRRF